MTIAAPQAAIAALLQSIASGDRGALNALLPLVYDELTVLAHRQRRQWHGDMTLGTTALVHEAYLKLVDQRRLPAESRAHFFAVAAKAMRHILCNYARDRGRRKRGGDVPHTSLTDAHEALIPAVELTDEQSDRMAALDEALQRLEAAAERQARVVECRFFGGMSVDETAVALDIAPRTVKRDWTFARAWLRREMQLTLDGD